jgi:cellulose synthase/poly-beta-1,6-N-acetylglucosamine synthase-like glycosyltransferase
MNSTLVAALAVFMMALVHALLLEGWRSVIMQRLGRSGNQPSDAEVTPSISVIVPARDAARSLPHLLQDLYAQDLDRSRYEVIVVDDHSSDGTAAVVERMQRSWPGLRLVPLMDGVGKKAAITLGAGEAYHDLLVITDADARCGPHRLSAIAEHAAGAPVELLLMPVETVAGTSLVHRLQRTEQLALQAVAAGAGSSGMPVLANGANMAFSRAAFFSVGGFTGDRWASGDDMFLLQRMQRRRKRVDYLLDPRTVVRVEPEATWAEALRQRLRWAGKMRAYREFAGLVVPLLGLLFPWLLLAVTVRVAGDLRLGQGLMNTVLLLGAAWLCWSIPILRLVGAMEWFFVLANGAGADRHRAFRSGLSTIPALIAFLIYAPAITILSIFVRPKWKGRRI